MGNTILSTLERGERPKQAVFVLQALKWMNWRGKSCANGSICNQVLLITDHQEMKAPIYCTFLMKSID